MGPLEEQTPMTVTRSIRQQTVGPRWQLLIFATLVALAGYFGPWVPHRAAGLVVTGLDLAEYVKFLPEVNSGQIRVERILFYLPLFVASLTAGLLAGRRNFPIWVRVLLALAAIPIALAMLPPAWKPSDLFTPEYRWQALAIAVCVAVALPGVAFTRYLPSRIILLMIAVTAVTAAVLPANSFLQIHPAITAVYHQPLHLGWGFWATLIGNLSVAVIAIAETLRRWRAGR
jgi:hypothetical protein